MIADLKRLKKSGFVEILPCHTDQANFLRLFTS